MSKAWVGFDLDGTLAVYDGWKGIEHIGEPIESTVDYAKRLLAAGVEVKIMTARACTILWLIDEEEADRGLTAIRKWCFEQFGQYLEVTAEKDFSMLYLVDDRAYRMEFNTGRMGINRLPSIPDVVALAEHHYSSENPDSPTYVKA